MADALNISNETEPPKKRQKLDENESVGCIEKISDSKETDESLDTTKKIGSIDKSVLSGSKEANVKSCRSEFDVGISEYASSHEGFSGILKQRYSDFIVNEINLDGKTVHLTSTELPDVFIKEELESAVLPPEALQKLQHLVTSEDKTTKVVIATEHNKEQRTLIHREIRQKFPALESETADVDGHKVVQAFHANHSDHKRRRKSDWPKERGEYCHFLMYKENKDTMQSINLIANCLKVKPDRLSYAGTKDGRAITVQAVSVFRVDARNLQGLNKVLNNVCVGNFEFKKTPLKLGDLKGNTFVVVLRNVDGNDEQIKSAMISLKNVGFINYFGLQRFGSSKNATHHIGLCLLKSQWLEAIDLILSSRCDEDNVLNNAYHHWTNTKNAQDSLKMLGGKKCLEGFLLDGLSKFGFKKDYVAALKVLPRNIRLMYVHAYQSYIWNVVVSKRIKEFGLEPVIGDLVFDKAKLTSSPGVGPSSCEGCVKKLTSADINKPDMYTIYDVIMPLPGYDVTYPQHVAGDWYEDMLSRDDLDIKNMRHKVKDYSLSGTYRHIIVRPDNVAWEVFRYDDPTIALVLTDLDCMMGVSESVPTNDGQYQALRMEFSLPASSYATMAVREILKTDSSRSFHSSLH